MGGDIMYIYITLYIYTIIYIISATGQGWPMTAAISTHRTRVPEDVQMYIL